MLSNVSPVSFQGNIVVSTFNEGAQATHKFITSKADDKLIQSFAYNLIGKSGENPIEVNQLVSDMFITLFEHILKGRFRNTNTPKLAKITGNTIDFYDNNAPKVNGISIRATFS